MLFVDPLIYTPPVCFTSMQQAPGWLAACNHDEQQAASWCRCFHAPVLKPSPVCCRDQGADHCSGSYVPPTRPSPCLGGGLAGLGFALFVQGRRVSGRARLGHFETFALRYFEYVLPRVMPAQAARPLCFSSPQRTLARSFSGGWRP